MESKILDDNYYQITGWMLNRLGLKGTDLQVYAIIYGFSQDGESQFTGSLQYLCDFTGTSKPTVIKALKSLVEKAYIIKTENTINGVTFNKYKANLQVVKKINSPGKETLTGSKETLTGGSKETLTGSKETLTGGSKETLPNNKVLYNKYNNNIYNVVLQYLNEKANTKFRSNSKTTQSHINARIAEGFSVNDFKAVIDKKCSEWLGTEFEQYLRPQTLFGTKFESYLNAPAKPRKGKNGIAIKEVNEDDLAGVF